MYISIIREAKKRSIWEPHAAIKKTTGIKEASQKKQNKINLSEEKKRVRIINREVMRGLQVVGLFIKRIIFFTFIKTNIIIKNTSNKNKGVILEGDQYLIFSILIKAKREKIRIQELNTMTGDAGLRATSRKEQTSNFIIKGASF